MNPDAHWQEVMKLAEKHGFLLQAYGGLATLATHEVQQKELGEEKYREIQKMNGMDNNQMTLF
ncbi:hypothetical protein ACDX78_10405 [Virgibacillus oceani]